jgi:hypothetical protein
MTAGRTNHTLFAAAPAVMQALETKTSSVCRVTDEQLSGLPPLPNHTILGPAGTGSYFNGHTDAAMIAWGRAVLALAEQRSAATGRPGEGPVRGVVEDVADLRHQLQDMERERDVSRGNAQMHMEAARDLAMQLEAAQADAERWRFVRDHATVSVDEYVWITTSSGHRIHVTSACAGAEAEQLIDASIVIKARGTK